MPDQQSPMPPDFAAAMPVRGSFDAGWHVLPLRVYYEDTDAGGVVYHGRYLGFAERGRTEMMRAIGFDMGAIVASGVAIAVRHCAVDYRGPARLDDAIEVATRVTALGRSSLSLEQQVRRGGAVLVEIVLKLVCVGQDFKPTRIPADLRAAIEPLVAIPEEK